LAERRSVAERDRQQQLFGQMPGFVGALSGPDHVFEYVNDAYLSISGRTGFVGKTVLEMFPKSRDRVISNYSTKSTRAATPS
jgi:hypothetical protein